MRNKKFKKYFHITIILIIILFNSIKYAQNNNSNKKVNTIGFMYDLFSGVDINDAQAGVKIWVSKIVKINNLFNKYNVKVKIYTSVNQVISQMQQDNLSMLSLTTQDYLNYGSKIGLEPALVPSINNDAGAYYYLLVKKDKNYNSLKDLKNITIGLTSQGSHQASVLWLDELLAKDQLPQKEKYFKKIIYSEKESDLILNLFFDQTDACIVSNHDFQLMKELNPQIGSQLKTILISPKYLWGIVCYTMLFDNKAKNLFYESALKFQNLPSGKQLFSLLKIDKLIPFKQEYLDNFKTLLKNYDRLVIRNKN